MRNHLLVAALALALAPSPLRAAQTDIRLPSDSTGVPGGTLAVRVWYPDSPGQFRWGPVDGAPVAIYVPGGFAAGALALENEPLLRAQGFVAITFLFPGGVEGSISSDGTYDDRGDRSQRALRDIARFATGNATDSLGRTLSAIVGAPARGDVVGLVANSNGGSISATMMSRHGATITSPDLAFLVPWESPTNDQVLTGETPARGRDPNTSFDADANGDPGDDVHNGAYLTNNYPQLEVDYTRLRWAPGAVWTPLGGGPPQTGLFYFDNNGNGTLDSSPPNTDDVDVDGDGIVEPGEDYPLYGLSVNTGTSTKGMLSVAAATQIESSGIISTWPVNYWTRTDSAAYWAIRDAMALLPGALANQHRLRGMGAFAFNDHVQATRDHAHVRQYCLGFMNAGRWYRLNPDRSYVEAVVGAPAPLAVDNDANILPTAGQMESLAEPIGAVTAGALRVAAAAEMADRTFYNIWTDNLPGVITSSGVSEWEMH